MIELHRHLDVSARISTLLELAQILGIEGQSTSLESFRNRILITTPGQSLEDVLTRFEFFQRVLVRRDFLERLAFEAVGDCWNEGIRKVELRFSPAWACEKSSLSWEEILLHFEKGIARALIQYPQIQVGLICIGSRDFGIDSVEKTVDFFSQNRNSFVGLDLAGNEKDFPCRLFRSSFQKAKKAGARITVHAGESCGPENIWEAIDDLGAERIGHGIAALQDPKLITELLKRQVTLEVCPTSNWITQCVPTLEKHPLKELLRLGVRATINTDDPGIFAVTLPGEVEISQKRMGLTAEDVKMCFEFAEKASFLGHAREI